MGMWGMYHGFKADEKHDGDNQKIGSSGDLSFTPYIILKSLKIYFRIWEFSIYEYFHRQSPGNNQKNKTLSNDQTNQR